MEEFPEKMVLLDEEMRKSNGSNWTAGILFIKKIYSVW